MFYKYILHEFYFIEYFVYPRFNAQFFFPKLF